MVAREKHEESREKAADIKRRTPTSLPEITGRGPKCGRLKERPVAKVSYPSQFESNLNLTNALKKEKEGSGREGAQ